MSLSSSKFVFCASKTLRSCTSSYSIVERALSKLNSWFWTCSTALLKLSSFSLTVFIHFLLINSKGYLRKFSFFSSSSEIFGWASLVWASDAWGADFDSSCFCAFWVGWAAYERALLAYPKTDDLVSIICYPVGTSDLLPPNKAGVGVGVRVGF